MQISLCRCIFSHKMYMNENIILRLNYEYLMFKRWKEKLHLGKLWQMSLSCSVMKIRFLNSVICSSVHLSICSYVHLSICWYVHLPVFVWKNRFWPESITSRIKCRWKVNFLNQLLFVTFNHLKKIWYIFLATGYIFSNLIQF